MPPPLVFGPFGLPGQNSTQPILRIGAFGPAVADLQKSLNILPSQLAPLGVDGHFGQFTDGRVREFQDDNDLSADGVFGPQSWGGLGSAVFGWLNDPTLVRRLAVVQLATFESLAGFDVAMKEPEQVDGKGVGVTDPADQNATRRPFRKGHNTVIKYFQTCLSPVQFQTVQNNVHHLTTRGVVEPMPHWCGMFALWAVKTALVPGIGLWDLNNPKKAGAAGVPGFRPATAPRAGDVGYLDQPFQHHFLLACDPFAEGGVWKVRTIEGNSGVNSEFRTKIRLMSEIDRKYTCY